MEEQLVKQWEAKNYTNSTIRNYIHDLRLLNNKQPIETLDFLNDYKHIFQKLEHYKPTTIRAKLIAALAVLKLFPESDLQTIYGTRIREINKSHTDNTTKSESQETNWMDKDEIMSIWNEYNHKVASFANKKTITNDQFNILLQFMILSLYVLTPPRRNQDYQQMLVIKKFVPEMTADNYLDVTKKRFIFNNYKTSKVYKQKIEEIPANLWNIIKIYLRHKPKTESFLCNSEGKPLPHVNSITLILNKIFGKRVGVSMLRNIFLSDKYKQLQPIIDELSKDTDAMGTSVKTSLNNYIKKT
jgi:hypothetical protein